MRTGDGFLGVYSVTTAQSFQRVRELYDHVRRVKDLDSVPFVLCGNKCDLEEDRQVSKEEGEVMKDIHCSLGVVSMYFVMCGEGMYVRGGRIPHPQKTQGKGNIMWRVLLLFSCHGHPPSFLLSNFRTWLRNWKFLFWRHLRKHDTMLRNLFKRYVCAGKHARVPINRLSCHRL